MVNKRPTLGRGLGALLGQPAIAQTSAPIGAEKSTGFAPVDQQLTKLSIDLLQRGKYQPRVDMRQETLQELADSIRVQGIIQPIVVRPVSVTPGQPTQYEIIAGERRWRAAQSRVYMKFLSSYATCRTKRLWRWRSSRIFNAKT